MSFPQTLDPAFPQTSGLTRQGDNEIRDFKQFLVDVMGLDEALFDAQTSAAMSVTSGGSVTFPNTFAEVTMPLFITKDVGQENNFLNPYTLYHADTERSLNDQYLVEAGYEYHEVYFYGAFLEFKIYLCFRVPNYFDINNAIYLDFNYFQSQTETAKIFVNFEYRVVGSGDNIVTGGTKVTQNELLYSNGDYKFSYYQFHPESFDGTRNSYIAAGDFSIGDTIQVYINIYSDTLLSSDSKLKMTNFRFIQYLQETE